MMKRTTWVALFVFNLSRFLSCLFLPPQMSPAICVGICRWKTRPYGRSRSTLTSSLPDFTWQSLIWQPSFLFLPPRPGQRDAATHCRSSITVQIHSSPLSFCFVFLLLLTSSALKMLPEGLFCIIWGVK